MIAGAAPHAESGRRRQACEGGGRDARARRPLREGDRDDCGDDDIAMFMMMMVVVVVMMIRMAIVVLMAS